jgi:RHS repeat-associated protein
MTQGGTTYYLAYDQVGSLRLITDNVGNSIKRVDYDSFGNIISDSNPSFAIPFGFAGGLHDPDTKFVRFGYRDYLPEIGKWTAKDPILFAGGDSNLYGYVANDPVNWIDPWGLEVSDVIGPSTAIDVGISIATTAAEKAGIIGAGTAIGVGVGLAPVSDFLLPNTANIGEKQALKWEDHMREIRAKERYLDDLLKRWDDLHNKMGGHNCE